jgi:BirA family transcriptional regulator, biotin operon repressor / biotin---[acetyl-CoA-carboxylase] ligase
MAIGTIILRFESVLSTNDAARDLIRACAAHGTVVVAEEQTSGRGTKGRSWHSPRGLGLYASFLLRWEASGGPGESFPLLPLVAGLAAADAVRDAAGVEARLKWPNDLVHGRRKLGGILTEGVLRAGAPGHAVVGIGLNVNHGETDFPAELRTAATSLSLITGRPADIEDLLARLCQTLDSWYNSLIRGDRDGIIRAAEERMAFFRGSGIRIATARGELSGTYLGLAPDGRLRLERTGRPESVPFEEILGLDWL